MTKTPRFTQYPEITTVLGINLEAVGSALTKPATTEDKLEWWYEGKFAVLRYTFESSGTGVTWSQLEELPNHIETSDFN